MKLWLVGGLVRDLVMEDIYLWKYCGQRVDVQRFLSRTKSDRDFVLESSRFGDLLEWAKQEKCDIFRSLEEFGTIKARHPKMGVADVSILKQGAQTIAQDLRLRDFRMNAMAVPADNMESLKYNGFYDGPVGLLDPWEGVADIRAGIIRTPGKGSQCATGTFCADPIRILRMYRFALQFNFDLDPETVSAAFEVLMESMSVGECGPKINPDRCYSEFKKMCKSSYFGEFCKFFSEHQSILQHFTRGLRLRPVLQGPEDKSIGF